MATTPYPYLRGLQLEGRHPHDAGIWGITLGRMMFGEGLPAEDDPLYYVPIDPEGPLPPPPEVPKDRRYRTHFYRRVRSIEECVTYLTTAARSISFGMELFPGFVADHGGYVPMPGPGERSLPDTHAIKVDRLLQDRRLLSFLNSWGVDWGNRGRGYLPYDYFDRYVFECWAPEYRPTFRYTKTDKEGPYSIVRWAYDLSSHHRSYGFVILSRDSSQRLGWAFAVERDGALEVEELYVRPEFRGRGLGRLLADRLKGLFRAKGGEVRLWVPFSDCRSESERTYDALVATVRRLGLFFHPCPVWWAAYVATNSTIGISSEVPIEPVWIPHRPKSTIKAALAAALALNAAGDTAMAAPPPPSHDVEIEAPAQVAKSKDFPTINSEDWGVMNRRRADLIRKKVYEGDDSLSADEREEFEKLQSLSRKALAEVYPSPKGDRALIESLRAKHEDGSESQKG
jgi:GNAT superfamily N-acetyltransferase